MALKEETVAAAASQPQPFPTETPSLPQVGHSGVQWRKTPRTEMAEALRMRSTAAPVAEQPSPKEVAANESAPIFINRYLERLRDEAEKINELSRQQEIAIRKFQSSVNGLELILLKHPQSAHLRPEQFCEIREAALTTVFQDESNRYVLASVELDLALEERQASEMAASLRSHSQIRTNSLSASSFGSSFESTLATLKSLWGSLHAYFEEQSNIAPFDVLVWCGGGVIGRIALELALAATPVLWHWVVGITVGAVVLGLYRLLFASRPDGSFIARVFLVLIGLGIGGQI